MLVDQRIMLLFCRSVHFESWYKADAVQWRDEVKVQE
jgi:hypothetical protein